MTTMTTPPPALAAAAGGRPFPMLRHGITLAGRSLTKLIRSPEQFIDVTLQPLIFIVLFVYIFGGAVAGSTHDYLQYVLPAIMVQTVLFSSMSIGVNLNNDVKEGVFDRFRSLPIPRSAPLLGAVMAELLRYVMSIVAVLGFGYVLGFRAQTDVLSVALGALLVMVFAWCLCWVSVTLGMVLREAGAVQGVGFMLMFPLTFGSNMFVPTDTMPGWLQTWVDINPVSNLVDAVRGLWLGGDVLEPMAWSLLSSAVIAAIFAPLAVSFYRRKT